MKNRFLDIIFGSHWKIAPQVFIALALGLVVGFGADRWILGKHLAFLEDEVSDYRDKLHNASPSEAAATIKELQQQVETLRHHENQREAVEWPALTPEQQKQWADVLRHFSSKIHLIVISEFDHESSEAFVDSLKKTFKIAGLPKPVITRSWGSSDGIVLYGEQGEVAKAFAKLLCQVGPLTYTMRSPYAAVFAVADIVINIGRRIPGQGKCS